MLFRSTAIIGFVVERLLIRRLYGRDPLYSLLLTFGLAFIIEDGTRQIWGANGLPPGDASVKQFQNPVHCVRIARDGLVYVCDRRNNRIQVFRKDGTFVKDFSVAASTRGNGSVWDLDFSADGGQTFVYIADGENNHVWLLLRENGTVLSRFARSGRYAGHLHWVHNMAVDGKGNIYTTEVDNAKRVQKFVYQGLFPISTD